MLANLATTQQISLASIRRAFAKIASLFSFAALAFVSMTTYAGIEGEVGMQARIFFEDGNAGEDRFQPSVSALLELDTELAGGEFVSKFFGRLDAKDEERTHLDLREALWTYYGDSWELKAGVGKVFWGVTESMHLVDIINQSDFVESLDGEEKLGQPMVKFSLEEDWGTVDLFWLPYFRERTFAGEDGRLLALPLLVSNDRALYESSAKQRRNDFAIRYSHYVGELEFAISHFSGNSREAQYRFFPVDTKLTPYYAVIDQTALELQYIYDSWLLKFEGISNAGFGDGLGDNGRYSAAVFGFEYTQVGIFETAADLGYVLEYLFDDRKQAATHMFERDIFAGLRYAFNDEDSSEILGGVIYDPKTEEMVFSVEANKRLANDIQLNIEARAFQGAEANSSLKTARLKDEDYLELELVKFF